MHELPVSLWIAAERLARAVRAAPRLLLLCDYDGTLAAIAPTPDDAEGDPRALAALVRVARLPGVLVGVVSGRRTEDVAARVPFAHFVAGLHGAELRGPGVNGGADLARARAAVEALRARVGLLARLPGVILEDKGAALALHTRLASPSVAREANERFEAAALGLAPLSLIRGKDVIEARPRGVDKGTAATAIAAAAGAGLVVYIGDDATDEDAFRVLPPEAITVLVAEAPRPTAARYWLTGVDEVVRFLTALADWRTSAAA